MSKQFLTGNFLPAYGAKFGAIDRGRMDRQMSEERLSQSFEARARKHRQRRETYRQGIMIGLVAALVLTAGAVNLNLQGSEPESFAVASQETVQMEEILQTRQIETPPPPPRPPIPVEVPDDQILDEDDLDLDASLDLNEPLADLPPPPPAPAQEAQVQEEPELFYVVEEMPELIGGVGALIASLDYPQLARKAGIEGVVVVQVVVNTDGSPSDPQVLKSVAPILDKAAVEAVMKQAFVPGKQRGRAVPVAMNIPVAFRLT